jgi:heterodisulfide reductase subunit B
MQVERLREAKATGADLLVTSCIKCQIHFKCAQQDPALKNDIAIPIRDLATVLADRL